MIYEAGFQMYLEYAVIYAYGAAELFPSTCTIDC